MILFEISGSDGIRHLMLGEKARNAGVRLTISAIQCGRVFDFFLSSSSDTRTLSCPRCGSQNLERLISVPSIRFDKARKEGRSLFRPFALPKPYTSTKDVFCLRETRRVNGYRKISLSNHGIPAPNVPLRDEVEVHLVPDVERSALEVRIWWENRMVNSVTYPLKEFPTVQF